MMNASRVKLFPAALFLILCALAAAPLWAAERPTWWSQAQAQAGQGGYGLLTLAGMQKLYETKARFTLLDVRTPQEFSQSHLPQAKNLQFDFSDSPGLKAQKREAILSLLGENKSQTLVIYDRSLQCPRSNIAASLIAGLGYSKVLRLAEGWLGWHELTRPAAEAPAAAPLQPGDLFPAHSFAILPGGDDRAYLGLATGQKTCDWTAIPARYLLVCLYHELCLACQGQLAELGELRGLLQKNPPHSGSLKIMAVGIGSSKRQTVRFRRERALQFPVFADPDQRLFHDLCDPVIPVVYLLEIMPDGTLQVRAVMSEPEQTAARLDKNLRAALAADGPERAKSEMARGQ